MNNTDFEPMNPMEETAQPEEPAEKEGGGAGIIVLVVLLLVLVVLVVAICRLYYQTKEAQRMIDKFDREREEKRDDDRVKEET